MSIIGKIFGDANKKYLRGLQLIIDKINRLEPEIEKLSNERLKAKTQEFKEKIHRGPSPAILDEILPEAFAFVREAAKRTLKQRHFDVQLIGGIVLHQGKIAEMKTGEGKTLAATLPLYLNALDGKGCHLVTVNDYLARRDTVWMGQIYHLLGLSVGCLNHEQSFLYDPNYKKPDEKKEELRDELGSFYVVEDFLRPCSRKEAYLADITYGTNNEFGFDYLRDNMAYDLKDRVQRGFNYAIIDEVDSILIDEARTPLIISGPSGESSEIYYNFARISEKLKREIDYIIDEKRRTFQWTEKGIEEVVSILKRDPWAEGDFRTIHQLENAIKAKEFFFLDKEYVIKDNQIIIVDEFTGRLMPGRRWSGGLHQAIEAKEHIRGHPGIEAKEESVTLASITFQNYFRMYKKLAGMTGTALTSAEEFYKVYNLEVISIPTNKPMIRVDFADRVYKTEKGKIRAIIEEIKKRHKTGQPILVGTRSVEKNEYLGRLLEREGIDHQILNAKHHQAEGQIIAQAGKVGAVTIATNMAGRGVDIILGGNPQNTEEAKKVIELGGLYVIGTERHEARRIDNQLRGRAGRQGDPGSSQFFVSLEDELMRVFGGEKIKKIMDTLRIPEDQPIEMNLVSKTIEEVQSRIEGWNFDLRKHLLEYDDVMNVHRETFYRKRKEILETSPHQLRKKVLNFVLKAGFRKEDYERKEKEIGPERISGLIKFLALRVMDSFWIDHLENMDYLRDSVRLRAYAQRNPLVEYKTESHKIFKDLLEQIEIAIGNSLIKASLVKKASSSTEIINERKKSLATPPARNDPCPCGKVNPKTGKPLKYKKCCWPKYS